MLKSKHFLFVLLFVTLIGFIAIVASIFFIVISTYKTYQPTNVNSQYDNRMLMIKSKNLNNFSKANTVKVTNDMANNFTKKITNKVENEEFYGRCGISNNLGIRSSRIVGGREVLQSKNYPWVSVYFLRVESLIVEIYSRKNDKIPYILRYYFSEKVKQHGKMRNSS